MSLTDTHRKLGVGEKVQWGDVFNHAGTLGTHNTWPSDIGVIISEDTQPDYYRPIIRETAPHIFDERNAPQMAELEEAKDGSEPVQAKTYDSGKPPLAMLPWKALREVAKVMEFGGRKYEAYNWKAGLQATRNASCAMRHIADYMDGHDKDEESGFNPLAHAVCRLLFLLENTAEGTIRDDRYKGGAK